MPQALHPALIPLSESLGELQHHNIARQLSTPESAYEHLMKYGQALMTMEDTFDISSSNFAKRLMEIGTVLIKKAGLVPHLVDRSQRKSPIPDILAAAGAQIIDNELKNHPQHQEFQFRKKIQGRGMRFVKRTKSQRPAGPILEVLENHNLALSSNAFPKWKEQPALPRFSIEQLRLLRPQLERTQAQWQNQDLLGGKYDWI